MQEHKNNAEGSEVDSIVVHLEAPTPCVFIKYNDQTITRHSYSWIEVLLNRGKQGEAMCLSEEVKKQILQESQDILKYDHETYTLNIEKLKAFRESNSETSNLIQTGYEQKLLSIELVSIPWHKYEENFNCLLKAAHTMLDKHPNTRIFSLGQSPAWMIKAAEHISKLKGEPREFGYIPFSGNFYRHQGYSKFVGRKHRPNQTQEQGYFNLLDKLGISPKLIVEKFEAQNVKTTIVDFIDTGSGLVSFLSELFAFSQQEQVPMENFNAAIEIILLIENQENMTKSFIFESQALNFKNKIFPEISYFIQSIDKGYYSDRLVPSYSFNNWDNPPEAITENKELIGFLNAKLNTCAKEYLDNVAAINTSAHLIEDIIPEDLAANLSGEQLYSDTSTDFIV
ncbi:MAG: hypothetical protein EOP33_03565 [Rickettsiaceae bacterium]|nr:MAG: hypothetical protein EOP33_03565 [Rickettsiaceae bacterium]